MITKTTTTTTTIYREDEWLQVPVLQKIVSYARRAEVEAGPHLLTYGLNDVRVSTKSLKLAGKLCRISAPQYVVRSAGDSGKRRLQTKKPTAEVLAHHEFLVILVDVDLPDLSAHEIYCVPRSFIEQLPTTRQRIMWIPLEESIGPGGGEAYVDWSEFAGLRGFQLLRGLVSFDKPETKAAWLNEPIASLGIGTISDDVVRAFAKQHGTELGPDWVNVGQLLQLALDTTHDVVAKHGRKLLNTRARLLEAGFSYVDGPFMQCGTKRRLVEDVMSTCKVTRAQATMVVDSARLMGWDIATWDREE